MAVPDEGLRHIVLLVVVLDLVPDEGLDLVPDEGLRHGHYHCRCLAFLQLFHLFTSQKFLFFAFFVRIQENQLEPGTRRHSSET